MNVYPENKIENMTLSASSSADLANVYHPYFDLIADFPSSNVTIDGNAGFYYPFVCSHFIIGGTNAAAYHLTLKNASGITVYDSGTVYLNRENIHIKDMPSPLTVCSFSLDLASYEPRTRAAYLYLGNRSKLPEFSINPSWGLALQSQSSRSASGHAYGLLETTLESFSCVFPRVDNNERRILKSYIKSVLNIKPHIIDPYPLARDEFEPMYVTLTDGIDTSKRDEHGFYWSDVTLSWQEAK